MHLDIAVRDCRVFVKQWSSRAHSLGYLLRYSKKLSTCTNNLLQAVSQAWSLHNCYRPPDALLQQLKRYAWLPSMCDAVMSLKDCCSRHQHAAAHSTDQHTEAMEHADTAILALGSVLMAVLRWCNLSQLMHTAQQQGAPKGAAAFRELFEQVWCHAGVFLLANYTAVVVAVLRQEVQSTQHKQHCSGGQHAAKQQWYPQPSPRQQQQLGGQVQQLCLDESTNPLQQSTSQTQQEQCSQRNIPPQSRRQQQRQQPVTSPLKPSKQSSAPEQQQTVPVAQLSMPSVWRSVQLPAVHVVWGPPNELAVWRSQGYGVTHSAAAELQLLLMLWGWGIRIAPTLGLQHHASGDVVLLLLEAAWLLDVCPTAATHQKRGMCLWNTPTLMLRLSAQSLLPADDSQDGSTPEPAEATGATAEADDVPGSKHQPKAGPPEQLLQQPQECSRRYSQIIHSCHEQMVQLHVQAAQGQALAQRVASDSTDKAVAGESEPMAKTLPRCEQKSDEAPAAAKENLRQLVFDALPAAEQILTAAAKITQPFSSAELSLLRLKLLGLSIQAMELEVQHQDTYKSAISSMQAMLHALHQRLEHQQADVLRVLHHPGMAGSLVQLPLQLLQHLQPLTDAQLKQAAVQFSRLDDTIRKLIELPTVMLQAEHALQKLLLKEQRATRLVQQEQQHQQQHQQQPEGLWHQHTSQLLLLAEAYIRCQHLSRVVGLEAGQLLAAVVPSSPQQLLHVLRNKGLVAGLAALVITRCKALQALLAETLEEQQVADNAAAACAAVSTAHEDPIALCKDHYAAHIQKHQGKKASGSTGNSSSSSSEEHDDRQHNSHAIDSSDDEAVHGSSDDEDSVSINSWCSSSSSILDSPGVLLHEKHLAIGSMAVHMLQQAVHWLKIIALWQICPAQHKATCQLSADAIAQLLDDAMVQEHGAPILKPVPTSAELSFFAQHMAEGSSHSGSTVSQNTAVTASASARSAAQMAVGPIVAAAGGVPAANDGAAGFAACHSASDAVGGSESLPGPAGGGTELIDAMALTVLPMACCMIQHVAEALRLLLPIWRKIAPAPAATATTAAAGAGGAQARGSKHSHSDSESDSDSRSEDEAVPSLKDIASWHQASASQTLLPATACVLSVLPSITAALQHLSLQQHQFAGLSILDQAFSDSVDAVKLAMGHEDDGASDADVDSSGIPNVANSVALCATAQARGDMLQDRVCVAALSMLRSLPFAFHEVLRAAALGDAVRTATGEAAGSFAASAGSSHLAASTHGSSQGCAEQVQAAVVDAATTSSGAAVAGQCKESILGSRSPSPSRSKLQQPSPRSNSSSVSSSSTRHWGCHNPQCVNLSSTSELTLPVYGCSACRSAGYACSYCSSACQQSHWPMHRAACKERRRFTAGSMQQVQ